MAVHEVAHQLEVVALAPAAGGEDLRLEQPVEAEQRRVAAQLVAHQRVGRSGPFASSVGWNTVSSRSSDG